MIFQIKGLSEGEKCDSTVATIPMSPFDGQNRASPEQSSSSSNDVEPELSYLDLLSTCAVERSKFMNAGDFNPYVPSTSQSHKCHNLTADSSASGSKSKVTNSTIPDYSMPGPSNVNKRSRGQGSKSSKPKS